MKRKIIFTLFLIMLPVLSFAGDKENLAEEIMKLTNMQKMMDQTKVQIQQMQIRVMQQLEVQKKIKKELLNFKIKLMK